jgi:hypothetical protein
MDDFECRVTADECEKDEGGRRFDGEHLNFFEFHKAPSKRAIRSAPSLLSSKVGKLKFIIKKQ